MGYRSFPRPSPSRRTAPSGATVGGPTYTPTATASSGLTVAITIDASSSSVCSITAGVVSAESAGTCTIDFNQAGNATYAARAAEAAGLRRGRRGDRPSRPPRQHRAVPWWPVPTYTPTATASGLAVAITSTPRPSTVCSITAGAVSFQAVGTCVVDFNQAGSANYLAAPQVQQSFAVGQGSQTITVTTSAPTGAVVGRPHLHACGHCGPLGPDRGHHHRRPPPRCARSPPVS